MTRPDIRTIVEICDYIVKNHNSQIDLYHRYLYVWFNRGFVTNLQRRKKRNVKNDHHQMLLCYADTDKPSEFFLIDNQYPDRYVYLRFKSNDVAKLYLKNKDFMWAVMWQRHKVIDDTAQWAWIFGTSCKVKIEIGDQELDIEDIFYLEAKSRKIILESGVFFAQYCLGEIWAEDPLRVQTSLTFLPLECNDSDLIRYLMYFSGLSDCFFDDSDKKIWHKYKSSSYYNNPELIEDRIIEILDSLM